MALLNEFEKDGKQYTVRTFELTESMNCWNGEILPEDKVCYFRTTVSYSDNNGRGHRDYYHTTEDIACNEHIRIVKELKNT